MTTSKEHVHYFRLFDIDAEDYYKDERHEHYPTEIIIKVEKDLRGLDEAGLYEVILMELWELSAFECYTFHWFSSEEITENHFLRLKGDIA